MSNLKLFILVCIILPILGFGYCTNHISRMEDETLIIAEMITDKCNKNKICPQSIEGWEKLSENRYRKDGFNFNPSFPPGSESDFRLFYHFAPDWDFFVYGGVGKEITSEKQGYIEF
ncbi:hypothetical protein [Vibrio syngnathi]|uniref:Uncharacterized protein n=1 Tax=Vibrio syngnathi TaxID=3034029 RepID=A0AA34TNU2_9VIBR|nr:hypothetical protein [Vibrio syngnathi]ARP38204.1 hypothetical protein K08M4_14490 [Vibrio syngnathi]